MTYADASAYLGLAPRTLRRYVRQRRIRAYRIGYRTVQFERSDLERFKQSTATMKVATL